MQHGFPNKPTALAWDASLRLMIIGTASGAIKVYPFFFHGPITVQANCGERMVVMRDLLLRRKAFAFTKSATLILGYTRDYRTTT